MAWGSVFKTNVPTDLLKLVNLATNPELPVNELVHIF